MRFASACSLVALCLTLFIGCKREEPRIQFNMGGGGGPQINVEVPGGGKINMQLPNITVDGKNIPFPNGDGNLPFPNFDGKFPFNVNINDKKVDVNLPKFDFPNP